jgi:hypothetical protein
VKYIKLVSNLNFCEEELSNQLVTVTIISFLKNFVEVGVPYLKNLYYLKFSRHQKHQAINDNSHIEEFKTEKDQFANLRNKVEIQNHLSDFDEGFIDITLYDYLEIVIQFGFIILFAFAFPLVPIMAWVTNHLEIQVDKIKLMYLSKRPDCQGALDIGSWYTILETLSFISIFTNSGILIFTSNTYNELDYVNKWIFFTFINIFYIIIKLRLAIFIPDVPDKIILLQRRHKNILEKMSGRTLNPDEERILRTRAFKLDHNIYVK